MIVVDASSLVAIFRREPDAAAHARCIAQDAEPRISAATVLEASIVLRGLKQVAPFEAEFWLDEMLAAAEIEVVAVTPAQIALARAAHAQFGKGSGHPARLNFGDCFAYALAKFLDVPLAFKGADFSQTDLAPALGRQPLDPRGGAVS